MCSECDAKRGSDIEGRLEQLVVREATIVPRMRLLRFVSKVLERPSERLGFERKKKQGEFPALLGAVAIMS